MPLELGFKDRGGDREDVECHSEFLTEGISKKKNKNISSCFKVAHC